MENKYIELLTKDGTQFIPVKKKHRRYRIFLLIIILILSFSVIIVSNSYARYVTNSSSNPNIKVAPWKYKVNASSASIVSIDLSDTIIENNYSMTTVIPGTKGKIALELDFTDSKVASDYIIRLDTSNLVLPSNLKLYTDPSMTMEFSEITGSVLLSQQKVTEYIYWKWEYTQEDETNEWTNKDLRLDLDIDLKQKIE